MKVTFVKFCDMACHIDGGKGAVIGMFNTIAGGQFPLVHPTFYICLDLEFEASEGGQKQNIYWVLLDPERKELIRVEAEIQAPFATEGVPQNIFQPFRFDQFVFPVPGNYLLEVYLDGAVTAEATLHLRKMEPPQHAGPPPGYS